MLFSQLFSTIVNCLKTVISVLLTLNKATLAFMCWNVGGTTYLWLHAFAFVCMCVRVCCHCAMKQHASSVQILFAHIWRQTYRQSSMRALKKKEMCHEVQLKFVLCEKSLLKNWILMDISISCQSLVWQTFPTHRHADQYRTTEHLLPVCANIVWQKYLNNY